MIKVAAMYCLLSNITAFLGGLSSCTFIPIKFSFSGGIPLPSEIGWFYPYNSILKELFDEYIFHVLSSGTFERYLMHYEDEKSECTGDNFDQVNFEFVSIFFMVLGLGIIVSFFVLIYELIDLRFASKRHNIRI